MKLEIKCVDLFCGAGGLTHGFIAAGLPVVAGVDLDEACRYPYEANNGVATFHARAVAKLKPAEVSSWFGSTSIRVLAGCAPCQPFSNYSNRYETKGTDRWSLLSHFARLVEGVRPDVVAMENVPTVTKHEVFDGFLSTLDRLGYHVRYQVLDSADYGLPQRRLRLVLLASMHSPIDMPSPTSRPATVRDAIGALPHLVHGHTHPGDPLHTSSRLSDINLARIRASVPGGTWRDWPRELVLDCHKRLTGGGYSGVYGRMEWDKPAPTITTRFLGLSNGRFGHPEQDRALSIREGAILQGFPLDYAFTDGRRASLTALGRMIGNAVPVDLASAVGRSIKDHIADLALMVTSERFAYPIERTTR